MGFLLHRGIGRACRRCFRNERQPKDTLFRSSRQARFEPSELRQKALPKPATMPKLPRSQLSEDVMKLEGGCYCGAVRYVAEGEPMLKAQCHCRECQYITGGSPTMFVAMPPDGLKYTKGAPKQFSRKDLEKPVTREFCAECGTHVVTRPQRPLVVIKVGTLDDPAAIMPQIAIYTVDKQPFHHVPEGMPAFERLPQR